MGENAIVTLENIKVSNSKVGIATKDGSNVKVKNIYLKKILTILLYIKKTSIIMLF